MRAIYVDAGSGAPRPVPGDVIRACRDAVGGELPLFVGGGIRRPEQAQAARAAGADFVVIRSEEHTSELQSQSNLVCRLLLEKKKKTHHLISTKPRLL